MDFVEVDGSQGEGGGQILRSAVAFSAIRRVPVRVVKIRAGREVPGLKRQHLSALRVLAEVFGGELGGATEGSQEVTFAPGVPRRDTVSADMGTAASITLVLQAVVPAVALSGSRLRLQLVGGTDVPWSPTFDYFGEVAKVGYRALGLEFEANASRRGYYPRGGGIVTASIEPCGGVSALDLTSRATMKSVRVMSRCGSLPKAVAQRQADSAVETLRRAGIDAQSEVSTAESDSPGTSVLVAHVDGGVFLGSDAVGAKGKPAEEVGREAAERFLAAKQSGGCMDANLADMLLPLLSLAKRESRVKIPAMTSHLESGLRLARLFTGCRWTAVPSGDGVLATVTPVEG
ncbi:MAG: RNA 3'-terminal phosphate cyclase [Nitrososphaerota archaeon]|jgi:RNA 3'-phosphate cyclase|nr:RNA 3'-terminal phosphate cyclase [Nitrososphaerota archaeon]MDG6903480.1 RNA 3'-terminal phosphate cyclase [Nitrososphaerota archaeon]MDG6912045.1 RNA 3'-terminal phosphate cyclase [Nitrososphaerota archaeon]MDG6924777.1 RNA 3'-terminal phosphate cyclase [Nitrososphaerota archaeon]MDG6940860.1 RNA 3'-terminal phosphate cyclase [Nitrososphaerota archaeon]